MKQICLAIVLVVLTRTGVAQPVVQIVPAPVRLQVKTGTLTVTPKTVIYAQPGTEREAVVLNEFLQQWYGFTLPVREPEPGATSIQLQLKTQASSIHPEAYHISTEADRLVISAPQTRGIFWGIQTLLQLLPTEKVSGDFQIQLPQVEIEDYPRFQYRGMLLDVARHFFAVDAVKKYIDYLAMHKFNTLHLHLTDDQGWRVEIKKYPRLTSVGGYRNGTIVGRRPGTGNTGKRYGGFYTQEQIRELVRYAADRHITILPEIEMPGHVSAAIAAYPELSCFPEEATQVPAGTTWTGPTTGKQVQQTWGVFPDVLCPKESTFTFLEHVLDEVIDLFPSTYIHIGGDECPKENWRRCQHCQQRIAEQHLKDEHDLQNYFTRRIEQYLNRRGRRVMGWEEILTGSLSPTAAAMSWHRAADNIQVDPKDHDIVMTPAEWLYFDYAQVRNEKRVHIGGYIPLQKVYRYNPVPAELDAKRAKHILGAQANVWTEYISDVPTLEYMIFPRMSALSEVLWTPQGQREWPGFQKKLSSLHRRYALWGAEYCRDLEEVP